MKQINGGRIIGKTILVRDSHLIRPDCKVRGTKDFQMRTYVDSRQPGVALVHFIGDETLAVDFPHGNSKTGDVYVRTAPSVLRAAEAAAEKPAQHYRQAAAAAAVDPTTQALYVPKNSQQVNAAQQRLRKERETRGQYENLIHLATEQEAIRMVHLLQLVAHQLGAVAKCCSCEIATCSTK